MAETVTTETTKLDRKKTSWRVYAVDKFANWVITIGGLAIVIAVLGMLVFIGSEALPLFAPAKSGEVPVKKVQVAATAGQGVSGASSQSSDAVAGTPSAATLTSGCLALACDEYRRVAIAIGADGNVRSIAIPTGEVFDTWRPASIGQTGCSAASVSTRPYRMATWNNIQKLPHYHVALGTSDGRVLTGDLIFASDYQRFEIGEDPPELARLRRPHDGEFQQVDYVPDVIAQGEAGSRRVTERLYDFGLYRSVQAVPRFDHALEVELGGEAVRLIHSAASPPEGGESEVVTVVATDSKVVAVMESYAVNAMSEEVELETTTSADLTSVCAKPLCGVLVDESLTRIVLAATDGEVTVISRERGKWQTAAPTRFHVLDASWQAELDVRRGGAGFARMQGPLELRSVAFVLGDVSLVFGDSHGGIQTWFPVRRQVPTEGITYTETDANHRAREVLLRPTRDDLQWQRIHALDPASASIERFAIAQKGKSFIAADAAGGVRAINMTSERTYFDAQSSAEAPYVVYYASKGDGIIGIDNKGQFRHWWIVAPHAASSFRTLFGKVHYEGYDKPEYVWQSSAGTDDVEPKLSLVPLLTGTIKGALYAMLFSVPIAILAALYTSEFMGARMRSIIKPTMEIMASLPSVVLGFLAALYMAPKAAPIMPSLIIFFLLLPGLLFFFGWLWQFIPSGIASRVEGNWRSSLVLLVVVIAAMWLSGVLGPSFERALFPMKETALPAHLDPRTFEPVDQRAQASMQGGNFRGWTGNGKPLSQPGVQIMHTTSDGASEVVFENVADATARFGVARGGALKQGMEAYTTTASGAKGESWRVLGAFPAGWWVPGGHALFAVVFFAIALPFVYLLIRVLFYGVSFFGLHLHVVKPGDRPLHPVNLMARLNRAIAGEHTSAYRAFFANCVTGMLAAGLLFGVTAFVVMVLGPSVESLFFTYSHPTAGEVADFRRFLMGTDGIAFQQSNSLIVGFALGFAVIPIIYTISEDALTTVPNQLRAASLACGASSWQTASRIVLPAAMPGIFSAMVIGLGRAIGETMIVVMAAGGTALMDLSALTGFRSLSLSIAIEMPEAPKQGTLYHTLFLSGFLLFVLTFMINVVAEIIRTRLRKKMARV